MTNSFDWFVDRFVTVVIASILTGYVVVEMRTLNARLADLRKSVESVNASIGIQTGQQSWLVSHYAEPKRPLFGWEKSRCRWCGQWVREDGTHEEEGE